MAKIMIQGTGSTVGKSILVTALCRIFKQDGYSVCPYKSQNMSLNSYITLDGKEMGRAQVLQAYAAGLEPQVYMNPILLKPTTDTGCQVIVNGKVFGNATAAEYQYLKLQFSDMLKRDFQEIEKQFDIIVLEGAGSPAEINLRDRDIVNMGMAELIDAPVLIAGDIDKGGVFAQLAGTMLLLTEQEKKRVKGTIINKFRGDLEILMPGIKMLEDIIKLPNLGVVPYFHLQLEDEDGTVEFNKKINNEIDVAVVHLPHISNFTDIDALKIEEDISVRFINLANQFGNPDLLIIPGSKNTAGDLKYLRESGLERLIIDYGKKHNGRILGICGGFQMLGKSVHDPAGVESSEDCIAGMNLLDVHTVFDREKVTTRVKAKLAHHGARDAENTPSIYGYEIHMGITSLGEKAEPLFHSIDENGLFINNDGAVDETGRIMGTYIHGFFDGTDFREHLFNDIRTSKGLPEKKSSSYESKREKELDKLADIVRNNIDMNKIYDIMGLTRK